MIKLRSLYDNILSESNKKCWIIGEDKKATFLNDELTIEAITQVQFSCVNLTKYKYFLVEMQIFNPTNNRMDVGINGGGKAIFISQGAGYPVLYELVNGNVNLVRSFPVILFNETNVWHKIQIEKKGKEITLRFDENIYDMPYDSKGDYIYFRKWSASFIKIKDIKILTTSLPSCKCQKQRKLSFCFLSLCLFYIK